jgi:O-antigen/teichoic acid export membrane protein
VRGVGSGALGQAISAASSILLVPLFLHAWGADLYGRWISLTALASYLGLMDLGGQSFIGNLLAVEYVRGNDEQFQRKLSEGVSLFCVIAGIGFLLLVMVLSIPHIPLAHRTVTMAVEDRLVVFSMGSAFLLAIPGGVYVTAYRAAGLFVRGALIGNVLRGSSLIFLAALLVMRVRPAVYAAGYLALGTFGTMVVCWDIRRRVPSTRGVQLRLAAAKTGLVHLSGSLYFWLLAISNALNQQGVVLVLALSGSGAGVALYATHRTACGLVGYVGNLVQAPLWPEFTFLHAQGRKHVFARAALLSMKVVTLLSACVGVALWALLPVVYPIWTGRNLTFNPMLLAILLTQAVLAAGWTTSGWPLLASNQHRGLARWALANGLLTVALSALLVLRWGVLGVACATLAGDIACGAAVYPVLLSRALGISLLRLYKAILVPLIVLIPAWVAAVLGQPLAARPLLGFLLAAVSIALIYPAARLAFQETDDVVWLWGKLRTVIGTRA